MRALVCINFFIWSICMFMSAKTYTITSPDNKIRMNIRVDDQVSIQLLNSERVVLDYSDIDLTVNNRSICVNPQVTGTKKSSVNNTIIPVVKVKTERIEEAYNELILTLKGGYSIVFRAYDLGASYRFKTNLKAEQAIVNEEQLALNIPASANGYLMQEKSFSSMSEAPYVCRKINAYENNSLYSLPALFRTENNDFLLITESDIYDYPGLWLSYEKGLFKGVLPQKAVQTKDGSCVDERFVTERAGYLAETSGKRAYPWRVFVVTDSESKLITNQLVYLLGSPAPESDYSWIQPGLATLDWWGRRNIFGTGFKGNVNTETHKYFVDFNNKYGLNYFVLDDGWSDACDLKKINPELDLDELSVYAKQKNVGLIFWAHAFALKQDIPGYLDFFKSKGAAGIKVDFIERDDQEAINLFHDIAREALKRELVIDFHGVCKPFGLNRTYPNVLTSEGLIEFEMNGITDWANP
ncbi:MAG: glycoside hydrolase family 97 catalytic domain-containing protein, partial [Tannerellaceae bacterium]|nr:glycoside hydrolase family 97 catalytic domain-containing protein [Tannerellaceae bacterium]